MFFVIFWTALVRYTWPSNSSRFFFRQSVLSDVFGLNAPAVWAQRCGAGGCRREATWISHELSDTQWVKVLGALWCLPQFGHRTSGGPPRWWCHRYLDLYSGRFAQMSPKQHLQVISSDQVPLGSYAWPKSRRPYDFHAKSRLVRSTPTIPVLERDRHWVTILDDKSKVSKVPPQKKNTWNFLVLENSDELMRSSEATLQDCDVPLFVDDSSITGGEITRECLHVWLEEAWRSLQHARMCACQGQKELISEVSMSGRSLTSYFISKMIKHIRLIYRKYGGKTFPRILWEKPT